MTLLAYHGNPALKQEVVAMMQEHRKNKTIEKQWFGACFRNYAEAEEKFGIPRVLVHLLEETREGLSPKERADWTVRFVSAPKPGADLGKVHLRLMHWLLTDILPKTTNDEAALRAIKGVADLMPAFIEGRGDTEAMIVAACAADAAAAYASFYAARASLAAAYADVSYAALDAARAAVATSYAATYEKIGEKLIELMEAAQ